MNPTPSTLLLVDDEPGILALLREQFRDRGYRLRLATDGAEALRILASEPVDLILSDMRMPGMSGAELLSRVAEGWPHVVRLVLTGYAELESVLDAVNRGHVYGYFKKPWDEDELALALQRALERKQLEDEARALHALVASKNRELEWLNERLHERLEKRELQLEASEARLRRIIDQNLDGLVVVDRGGAVRFSNPAACALLGVGGEDLWGRSFPLELSQASAMEVELPESGADPRRVDVRVAPLDWEGDSAWLVTLRDITERWRLEGIHAEYADELQQALVATVQAMAITIEKRDPYTAGHQQRVAALAGAIGEEMGLSQQRVDGIRLGGLIHDIGKIYVPAEILNRPGTLSDPEFSIIRAHPLVGYEILQGVSFPWPVAEMVWQHHERLDGSGYPQGLRAADIILEARILAVADVIEAMASHRPYRPGLGLDAALAEVQAHRGVLFDSLAVDACLTLFRERGFRF